MPSSARLSLPFAVCLLLASSLPAQTVRGRVVEAGSDEPIAGARVEALDGRGRPSGGRTLSAEDGTFVLPLRAAGSYVLRARRLGYPATTSQRLEVALRDTVVVDVRMSQEPLLVDPVVVTAHSRAAEVRALRDAGFYDRQRAGFGRFMERPEIERHRHNRMVEILDRMPGTQRIGGTIVFRRSSLTGTMNRAQHNGPTHCMPKYYVDGAHITVQPPQGIDEVIGADDVEAIELYSSAASIPARFNDSESACGVVLIWTRVQS